MSETNQAKSSASGSESVGAALKTSMVLGASDGLIGENQKADIRGREEARADLAIEQWESFSGSSEDEEAQEESTGSARTGRTAGLVSSSAVQGAAAAGTANVAISSDAASSATGASGAGANSGVSDNTAEEGADEESDETEENAREEAEDEAEEDSAGASGTEEETASESASIITETIALVADSSRSFELVVREQPIINSNYEPEAIPDGVTVSESGLLLFDPLANDNDVNDESENFSLDSVAIVDSIGDSVRGQGSVSIIDNQLQFSPGNDFETLASDEEQVVTVQYVMSDDEGTRFSSTVKIIVTGENDIPVAMADTAAGSENQTLLIDVLANDTDADHDDVSASFTLGGVSVVDDNGNPVTGQGSAGIVNNQLQFTPGADFDDLAAGETETVTVRYVMHDDEGAVSESEVIITVTGTNDAPVLSETVLLGSSSEDSLIEITEATLLANASDVDGGQLSVRSLASDQGILSDNGNGSWLFEPHAHFSGTANITFDVFDGVSSTPAGASIVLTPVVDLPALTITPTDNPEMTGESVGLEDTAITLDLTAVLVDSDGSESLSISITDVPEGAVLSAGEQNPDGSWSLTATDLDNLEITPPLNFNGDITLTVTAIATEAATGETASISETLMVNVLPVNDPPSELALSPVALSHTVNTQPMGNGSTFVTLNEHADDFGGLGTGAISLWVKMDSDHANATLLSMTDSTTSTQSFFIAGGVTRSMNDESLTFASMNGSTHFSMMVRQGESYLFDDQWHHVVAVVDGIDNRMYIDGERMAVHFNNGSATTSLFTGTDIDLVNIGSLVRNGDLNGSFGTNGEIAEVGIFGNTVGLDDSSIKALMNQGPDYFDNNDLLFSTDFSGTGDTVTDTSGNGRNGTAFSGNLATRESFTVDAKVAEDDTLLLQEVDLLNGFSDLEGDSLSIQGISVDHGAVVNQGDGHWIFTPDNNFHGEVSFSVEVTDGTSTVTAIRTVTVTSINDAPVAFVDTSNTSENATLTLDVLANDSDVDHNDSPANFSLDSVEIVDASGNPVTGQGSVTIVNNQLQFTPGNDFDDLPASATESVTIRYVMSDDEGETSVSSVNITVTGVNDAPVISEVTALGATGQYSQIIITEAALLANAADVDGDNLSVQNLFTHQGIITDHGNGSWLFTPTAHSSGTANFSFDVYDGATVTSAQASLLLVSDDASGQPINQSSLDIANSTFQIMEGALLGTDVSGKIVADNGYTSLDQWLLNHEGGALTVSLNTADGISWSAGVRLLHSDVNGSAGVEVGRFSGQLSETGQAVQVLEFNDLPAGHYQLVLGNDGFDESSATSALDYPGVVSGEHGYEVAVSGQVSIAALPRDPGQNARISGETWGQTEGILTLAVVNNEAEMVDTDNTLYYEVFNSDTRVGQGAFDFSSAMSPQDISITINNEPLETLTLDEVQVVFHEVNVFGEVVSSQTFGFDQATIPDGDTVTVQGGDGLQGLELIELGLDYFELGFSELTDDMQEQYSG
ncbi:cadherin-like domain-containing protein [Endozoicomonas sp.]|uniref:cadherin-like domain-containing protein n=1 Tax=Endozoicomonas sp. TaxID=1892382 RepID=UPI0028860E40|nr:cadherin-like domain-containing protein [Endozoicomonas sp.]